ncbi:hypothetical protein BB558_001085 [Smittium angustum]|uniref:4a-hydroxytetrahydrobiopterin dehydratase n=1 Tax=Smittium angustum TaxID=133377 RepID=A0A2U1JCE4_SMIAN|nr:hypothetical protein BB558_001085 [Smittium angustum]
MLRNFTTCKKLMSRNISEFDYKTEIAALVKNGWSVSEGQKELKTEFKFKDHPEAIRFVVEVGTIAEKMGHYPEWSNIYNIVWVKFKSDQPGGVGSSDIKLAQKMQSIAQFKN